MDEELRHLKDSLDDTYFHDLTMSNSLKKQIMKRAVKSDTNSFPSHMKFITSILVAAICLIAFTFSILQQNKERAEQLRLREQQLALLELQEEIVGIMQSQNNEEKRLLNDVADKKSADQIEQSREYVLEAGEGVAVRIEKLTIPPELLSFEDEIKMSLTTLSSAYRMKNQYYQSLKTEGFTFSHVSFYSGQTYAQKIYEFEAQIGSVYEEVDFLTPRFITLLSFEPFPY